MNSVIQFATITVAFLVSISLALLIEWLSLWGLWRLMRLMPARPSEPVLARQNGGQTRALRFRQSTR
jgi:hypothetical protein